MSETEWIKRHIVPLVTAKGADGLRDDVAVLSGDGVMIASMDTLIEGVHFLKSDPVMMVGRKLVRVNVSDILAKGALPHEALLSIAWPRGWVEDDFAALMRGIGLDLNGFGISLIGGDTVGTEGPLSLTMTLTGRCLGAGPVRRGGGKAGDQLWISGEIGWGRLGLEAALSGGDVTVAKKYRVPEIGDLAAASVVCDLATASIDVSDGLLIDALRLGEASGCGAVIVLDAVPLARASDDIESVLEQCTGGDDYKILLAASAGVAVPEFTRIGELVSQPGLSLRYKGERVNAPVTLGFEH